MILRIFRICLHRNRFHTQGYIQYPCFFRSTMKWICVSLLLIWIICVSITWIIWIIAGSHLIRCVNRCLRMTYPCRRTSTTSSTSCCSYIISCIDCFVNHWVSWNYHLRMRNLVVRLQMMVVIDQMRIRLWFLLKIKLAICSFQL